METFLSLFDGLTDDAVAVEQKIEILKAVSQSIPSYIREIEANEPQIRRVLEILITCATRQRGSATLRVLSLNSLTALLKNETGGTIFNLVLDLRYHLTILQMLEQRTKTESDGYIKKQAFRFFYICSVKHPTELPDIIIRSFVSIAHTHEYAVDNPTGTPLFKSSVIVTLCQLAMKNPAGVLRCGGFKAICSSVTDVELCATKGLTDYVIKFILHMLSEPGTAKFFSRENIYLIFSPLFLYDYEKGDISTLNKFFLAKRAYELFFKSWTGFLYLTTIDIIGITEILDFIKFAKPDIQYLLVRMVYNIMSLKSDPIPFLYNTRCNDDLDSVFYRKQQTTLQAEGQSSMFSSSTDIIFYWNRTLPQDVGRSSCISLRDNFNALVISSLLEKGLLRTIETVSKVEHPKLREMVSKLMSFLIEKSHTILSFEQYRQINSLRVFYHEFAGRLAQDNEHMASKRTISIMKSLTKKSFQPENRNRDVMFVISNIGGFDYEQVDGKPARRHALVEEFESTRKLKTAVFGLLASKDVNDNTLLLKQDTYIEDTKVLEYPHNWNQWNFYKILLILNKILVSNNYGNIGKYYKFFKTLLNFFGPYGTIYIDENNAQKWVIGFPLIEKEQKNMIYVEIGCRLMDVLIKSEDKQLEKIIQSHLGEIYGCIRTELTPDKGVSIRDIKQTRTGLETLLEQGKDMLGSARMFEDSFIQKRLVGEYFTILGRLTRTRFGVNMLNKAHITEVFAKICGVYGLSNLAARIVCNINYVDESIREVYDFTKYFSIIMDGVDVNLKVFLVSHLRLLWRLRARDFYRWGIGILVRISLYRQEKVNDHVIDLFEECCEESELCRLSVLDHATRSADFMTFIKEHKNISYILAGTQGCIDIVGAEYYAREIEEWAESKYVEYFRKINARFEKVLFRGSGEEMLLPVNLFAEVMKTDRGRQVFLESGGRGFMEARMSQFNPGSVQDVAFLLTVGAIGSSDPGFSYLWESGAIKFLEWVESMEVIPKVRGILHFACGLISLSPRGMAYIRSRGYVIPINGRGIVLKDDIWGRFKVGFGAGHYARKTQKESMVQNFEESEAEIMGHILELTNKILRAKAKENLVRLKVRQNHLFTKELHFKILETIFNEFEIDFETKTFIHRLFR